MGVDERICSDIKAGGLQGHYPYCRMKTAYYARKAEIKAAARGSAQPAIICLTLDEFTPKPTGCGCPPPPDRACGRAVALQINAARREQSISFCGTTWGRGMTAEVKALVLRRS